MADTHVKKLPHMPIFNRTCTLVTVPSRLHDWSCGRSRAYPPNLFSVWRVGGVFSKHGSEAFGGANTEFGLKHHVEAVLGKSFPQRQEGLQHSSLGNVRGSGAFNAGSCYRERLVHAHQRRRYRVQINCCSNLICHHPKPSTPQLCHCTFPKISAF
jgi:hypothetical protein